MREDRTVRQRDPDNEHALEALLAYIRKERDRQREEILEAARREASDLVAGAFSQARKRVSEAVERERAERRGRLRTAHAAAQARMRQRRHALTRQRLDEAWGMLEQELERRWADAGGRQSWTSRVLEAAAVHLPAGTWTLAHPPDSPPDRGDESFKTLLEQRPEVQMAPVADSDLRAGIRLSVGNAVLDGSAPALLARRTHVEGMLLGRIIEQEQDIPLLGTGGASA